MTPIFRGYQTLRPLGKGGMGETHLVSDPSQGDNLFALKTVSKDAFAETVEMLRREFATLIRLSHPNIARVYQFGEEKGVYFFLEEYIDGTDIFQATFKANYNQILAALSQILRALIYLHQQGLVHGDLKAENILVVRNASLLSADSIKLIDFGLTRHRRELGAENFPAGSLFFMAPEILLEKPYDHRADLYALGVCLYRMITGRYPFEEEQNNMHRLVQAQINQMPVDPQRFQSDLPEGLNKITMRLLAKAPEDRYGSALEVLSALNQLEGERFPYWTQLELQLALREGPFIGRERELTELKDLYHAGRRELILKGEPGIGKSRLEREFRYQLQLAGEDDSALQIQKQADVVAVAEAGAVVLAPWGPAEIKPWLEDRFRGNAFPKSLQSLLAETSMGIPGKLILLIEFCLAEGIIRLQGDRVEFKPAAFKKLKNFSEVLSQKAATLEKNKREVLQLCAFARQPLSVDTLSSLTGHPPPTLQSLLESMERENWLLRVLHNGLYQYQAKGEALQTLLTSGLEGKSFDALLKLIDETFRSGKHLQAMYLLESFLAKWENAEGLSRGQKIELFRLASLIHLEAGELDTARLYCEKFLKIPHLAPVDMAKILNRLGWIEYRRGNYPEALKIFAQAQAEWNQTNDAAGLASVANFQASTHQALKDLGQAQIFYRKAVSHLPEDHPWRPLFRNNLAACLQEGEDFEGAVTEYEKAREEAERGTDFLFKARLLNALSNLYLYLGQLAEAKSCSHASLKLSLENGIQHLEGQGYLLLSAIADREGNLQETRDFVEKAVSLFEKQGSARDRAIAKLHLAYYWFTAGEDAKTEEILAELRRSYGEETSILAQCDLLTGKIFGRKETPDVGRGMEFLNRALDFYQGKNDLANLWEVRFALGQLQRRADPAEARHSYQTSLRILESLAAKVPEKYRGSFFRDRKRERILSEIAALEDSPKPAAVIPAPSPAPVAPKLEAPAMNTQAFVETSRITRLLASGQNLNFLLETILEESLTLLNAERGFILLLENGDFQVKTLRNLRREIFERSDQLYSQTIARQTAVKGESILVKNALADERFRATESVMGLGIRAALSVPMKIGPDTLGVIYVDNRFRAEDFDEAHQRLLEVFADHAALAVRNARQMEEIQAKEKTLAASMSQIEELNRLLKERLHTREYELTDLKEKFEAQQGEFSLKYSYDQIIGQSEKLREVLKILDRVTDSNATVLITGESGTGKELIARALHFNSPRKKAPFLAENCSAFSETLLESELFGHVKGSFTGALTDRKGIFEVGDGGTVFLDELGEMAIGMQPKLLRVLQERQVRPLGGKENKEVDVRLVAATNKNLEELVKAGKFREDLFYRVNVIRIQLPPLRERREDIPLLVEHFLKDNEEKTGKKLKIHPKALELLVKYDWPGNIRELANEIQKCCAMGQKQITPDLISEPIHLSQTPTVRLGSLEETLRNMEKTLILEALKKTRFAILKAADLLGISRITLYKKMQRYKIKLKSKEAP